MGDFWFSALKIHCYIFPTKFFLNNMHFKARPPSAEMSVLLCHLSGSTYQQKLNVECGFFQHVFPKIRVLCKIMVGLSTEFKPKWKLVEHYCTVLCSWPVDQQKKE